MKKSLVTSDFLVLGLFLAYASFGGRINAARADQGEDQGGSIQATVGAGVSVSVQSDGENRSGQQHMEATSSDEQGQNGQEMDQEDVAATSTASLKAGIEHRQAEVDAEATSTEGDNGQENEHGMSAAVHALLSARTLLGGIGPQVSALAHELGNSTSSTAEAEAKIASRGWFARLLFGGDEQSAAAIQAQVDKNKADIQQLQNLISGCGSCSAEVKTLLQDQLNVALAEQTRLQAMAQAEIDARGIFGTILGWFGK